MTYQVIDCTDPKSERQALILPIRLIVRHHCSLKKLKPIGIPDAELTGQIMAHIFETRSDLGTGKCRPYHIGIGQDGKVYQMISLLRRGAHAMAYNVNTVAVVTFGEDGTTAEQRAVLPYVVADMLLYTDGVPVRGHTSLGAGAARDLRKVCPHPSTNVDAEAAEALSLLTVAGCKLPHEERVRIVQARGYSFN